MNRLELKYFIDTFIETFWKYMKKHIYILHAISRALNIALMDRSSVDVKVLFWLQRAFAQVRSLDLDVDWLFWVKAMKA